MTDEIHPLSWNLARLREHQETVVNIVRGIICPLCGRPLFRHVAGIGICADAFFCSGCGAVYSVSELAIFDQGGHDAPSQTWAREHLSVEELGKVARAVQAVPQDV